MAKSINREIIEELDLLKRRAQQIALHNYDEIEIDKTLPIQDQSLYCFLIALEERKRAIATHQTQQNQEIKTK